FILQDSTQRKGQVTGEFIDPEYLRLTEFRSAINGKRISKLKPGEAIIGERLAKKVFGDRNPIGAIQVQTGPLQPIPVTVVDVYRHMPSFDNSSSKDALLFCLAESIEDQEQDIIYMARQAYVVLKEGYKESQLFEELNDRMRPLGMEATVDKTVDQKRLQDYYSEKSLAYTIGTLILLAAIIGFLRIQSQMFTLRQRELTLRIINGSTLLDLFRIIFTELAITLVASIAISIGFGIILQDFLCTKLDIIFNNSNVYISDLWPYSLSIGVGLLMLCGIIALLRLIRIRHQRNGLILNLRKRRHHIFRSIMLALQIAICILFVSATFLCFWCGKLLIEVNNIPEDDELYDESLLLQSHYALNPEALLNELRRLPDLDRLIMCNAHYSGYEEIMSNQELMDRLHFRGFMTYCSTDTTLLSFFGIDVDWLDGNKKDKDFLLIGETLYHQLEEAGLSGNYPLTMNYQGAPTLTVAGKFRNMPYDKYNESIIAITDQFNSNRADYVLVAREGRAKELTRSVHQTIDRIESENIYKDSLISNFRNHLSTLPAMVETLGIIISILAVISLLISSMSIFSTIALETRSRLKEVAIRKVNGAKSRDIYRLFGRVYAVLIPLALAIAISAYVSLTQGFNIFMRQEVSEDVHFSPLIPLALGILTVILLIAAIVWRQIHLVMRADPASIIAKE
ncbi:MAG: ABC transporter permease, partial [Muribaculaceae bacterium]|nr:ABC transporter permease [Muribaculaceae bacterium]